jgi:hypothetical protein
MRLLLLGITLLGIAWRVGITLSMLGITKLRLRKMTWLRIAFPSVS